MEKGLDLYLTGDFARELLTERRARLEENLANLRREHNDLPAHLHRTVLSDTQINEIYAFCEAIRENLELATFEQKRQLLDVLDVRGKLAVENDEKVIYIKCLISQQRLSLALTLP